MVNINKHIGDKISFWHMHEGRFKPYMGTFKGTYLDFVIVEDFDNKISRIDINLISGIE